MRAYKITKFDRDTARRFSEHISALITAEAAKFGLTANNNGGSFTDVDYATRIRFSVLSETGVDVAAQRTWDRYAIMVGMKKEWFGQKFIDGRNGYRIIGFMPRSHRYPVLAERDDGAKIKFTVETVISRMSNR